jgi:GHMP kinase-like protein
MIECAREAGAAANYTGSGGAIVCVCDDQKHRERVAEALAYLSVSAGPSSTSGCSTLAL